MTVHINYIYYGCDLATLSNTLETSWDANMIVRIKGGEGFVLTLKRRGRDYAHMVASTDDLSMHPLESKDYFNHPLHAMLDVPHFPNASLPPEFREAIREAKKVMVFMFLQGGGLLDSRGIRRSNFDVAYASTRQLQKDLGDLRNVETFNGDSATVITGVAERDSWLSDFTFTFKRSGLVTACIEGYKSLRFSLPRSDDTLGMAIKLANDARDKLTGADEDDARTREQIQNAAIIQHAQFEQVLTRRTVLDHLWERLESLVDKSLGLPVKVEREISAICSTVEEMNKVWTMTDGELHFGYDPDKIEGEINIDDYKAILAFSLILSSLSNSAQEEEKPVQQAPAPISIENSQNR